MRVFLVCIIYGFVGWDKSTVRVVRRHAIFLRIRKDIRHGLLRKLLGGGLKRRRKPMEIDCTNARIMLENSSLTWNGFIRRFVVAGLATESGRGTRAGPEGVDHWKEPTKSLVDIHYIQRFKQQVESRGFSFLGAETHLPVRSLPYWHCLGLRSGQGAFVPEGFDRPARLIRLVFSPDDRFRSIHIIRILLHIGR
jgi:hypothetical protein